MVELNILQDIDKHTIRILNDVMVFSAANLLCTLDNKNTQSIEIPRLRSILEPND